jgi:hypothetical protein
MFSKRRCLALGAVLSTFVLPAPPASAITGGEPDGDGHPSVGAILAFVPNRPQPLLCTSVLIHPRVVLTAGHCLHGFNVRGVTPDQVAIRAYRSSTEAAAATGTMNVSKSSCS